MTNLMELDAVNIATSADFPHAAVFFRFQSKPQDVDKPN